MIMSLNGPVVGEVGHIFQINLEGNASTGYKIYISYAWFVENELEFVPTLKCLLKGEYNRGSYK